MEPVRTTRTQHHNGITWIDVEKPTRADMAQFAKTYNFQPLHIEECLADAQLPQAEVEKDYVFLLLHYPQMSKSSGKISTSQVGVFLGHDYLLTVHDDATGSVGAMFSACEADPVQCNLYIKKSPGYVLYGIIGKLLEDLSALMPSVLEELAAIEDQVFDNRGSDAYQIGQLRQKIMKLRRITAALKTMLEDLSTNIREFTGEDLHRYYKNNLKMAKHLWETVEEATETVEIYKDADFTTSTERTNDILAILTLIFTLTIPATVIGTLYGMNIQLPGGTQAAAWTFWGDYSVFKLILVVSTVAGFIMYLYFRKRRWF